MAPAAPVCGKVVSAVLGWGWVGWGDECGHVLGGRENGKL